MNLRKAGLLGWGVFILAGHMLAASMPVQPTVLEKHTSGKMNPGKINLGNAGGHPTVADRLQAHDAFIILAAALPDGHPLKKSITTSKTVEKDTKTTKTTTKTTTTSHVYSKSAYPALDFLQHEPIGGSSSRGVRILRSGISHQASNVDLAIGKAEVVYLSRPISRVSVSNPDVAAAVVISPTQIQLIGRKVGVANLLLWGDLAASEHTVIDVSVHRDVSVLIQQLKYVDPGIHIVPMAAEDTVILTGSAETRESAQLAIEMAKAFFSGGSSSNASSSSGIGSSAGASTSASSGGSSGSSSGSGISSNNNGPNSQAPGSSIPGSSPHVINLIKVKGEPSTKLELVRQRMREINGNIRVDVVPGPGGVEKVILSGRVPSASVASRALNLASVFYGKPGLKVVTGQGGNDFSRLEVNGGTSSSGGGSDATATMKSGENAGGANVLHGSVLTDASGNVVSMMEIDQKPQIRCNIKFLELNKIALNSLGSSFNTVGGPVKLTSWSGNQSGAPNRPIAIPSTQNPPGADWGSRGTRTGSGSWQPLSQTVGSNWNEVFQNGVTQVFSINNQFVAAIQALAERRQVRTLAEPTLTMLSGEQGSFLAGGEVPVAFLGGNGQISIQFKAYGIRLNLLPEMTDDGKIQMQVAPEVSAVDPSISVQGVPGFLTRKMNTSLLVEPGQSFILAGLFKQEDTDSTSRFPGLGSLPIIGSFFRNQWKNKNNSEMVIIVKPEVLYSHTGSTTTGNTTVGTVEQ